MIYKIVPRYIIRLLLKMGIFLLIFSLCRVLFLIFNTASFPVVYFTDFLAGMWFDLVTAAIVFLPLGALETLPNKWRGNKWFQVFLAWVFHITLFLCILINLIDIEYFKFTAARSTTSLFTMLSFGEDLQQQMPSFIAGYWYLLLFLIAMQFLGYWLYKRANRIVDDSAMVPWWKQIILFPLFMAILVVIGRGGFGLRPVAPAKAAAYTIEQNIPLVLNSAFTVIKTWGSVTLEEKEYFSEFELVNYFNPVKQYQGAEISPTSNVVLLVLESFSVEYIASINGTGNAYTPFLDSLIDSSLVFTNCYANGKKSIDAMPSIVSSVPKLMEIEYLTSQYASNRVESIPKLLADRGYNSSFFHGATNGTMSFDVFCDVAGYDKYYGRSEYNNEAHYDGTWGIYDEEFLSWSADQMSAMQQPFFSTIFTISSHPPYSIPEKHKSRFNKGAEEMHNAVMYADYALSQFFEKIKTTTWYQNTLFIIVADHTPASGSDIYFKDMGNMHIPLVFFHPSHKDLRGRNDKVVSQADVMPTVMDLLGYEKSFYAFGQSVFDSKPGYSASYVGNKYLYFYEIGNEKYMLTYQDEQVNGIYNLKDQLQTTNLMGDEKLKQQILTQLKALIQTYNHALISNQMTVE
ncbi:MAG: sulfatase-like hydrolase/transferase [Crocinitomicaceae bacterium]|nr:sulfatase-like hydrolase/transferase [Crocinitomicaceae bacterium]